MNCEQFANKLDALIDGELDAVETKAMEAHAAQCAKCAADLRCARMVRETMLGMDDDMDVPLQAQAAWRSEVKRCKNRSALGKRLRAVGAVAAAVVILVGSVTMIGREKNDRFADTEITLDAEAAGAYVESDGAVASNVQTASYACREKFKVSDPDAAQRTLAQLVSEYNGAIASTEGAAGGEVSYRIEIPGSYLGDFLSAVGTIGQLQDRETREWSSEPEIVYIQVVQ